MQGNWIFIHIYTHLYVYPPSDKFAIIFKDWQGALMHSSESSTSPLMSFYCLTELPPTHSFHHHCNSSFLYTISFDTLSFRLHLIPNIHFIICDLTSFPSCHILHSPLWYFPFGISRASHTCHNNAATWSYPSGMPLERLIWRLLRSLQKSNPPNLWLS